MLPDQLLIAVLAVLGGLLVGSCGAIAIRKWVRSGADARDERAETRARALLVRVVAGSGDDAALELRSADGRAVERIATELLGKVRGEAHEALVAVLTQRGALEIARRRLYGRSGAGRARAAELLGMAADRRSEPDLVHLLRTDRDREVRVVAARALGRVGGAATVDVLFAGLRRGLPASTVAQAVLQLGPAAEPGLRRELDDGDVPSRALAAQLLGVSGSVATVAALTARLGSDPDASVRAHAAGALGRLGSPSAIDALVRALAPDRSPRERIAAVDALGRMSARPARSALAPLVADPDVRIARSAARALASLGETGRSQLESMARQGGTAADHAREALAIPR